MRIFALLILSLFLLSSCGSSKRTKVVTKKDRSTKTVTKRKTNSSNESTINNTTHSIIATAEKYEGVRYKYGGDSKKGMDCSGLVVTAFKSEDIILPRTTREMSSHGDWIDLKKVSEGDLLFFATNKNSRKVNHVGIVTKIKNDEIQFIHSTTSKGVITSKLSERYWYLAFVQARRVL